MPGSCTIDSLQLLCGSDVYNHGIFSNARILACHTTVSELDSAFDLNYAGNLPETVKSVQSTFDNILYTYVFVIFHVFATLLLFHFYRIFLDDNTVRQ